MHPLPTPSLMMLGSDGGRAPGYLFAWGQNTFGQLGNGNTTSTSAVTQIGSNLWKHSAGGTEHTLAVRADGTLWAWGRNVSGQLGRGNLTSYSSPVQVGALSTWESVAIAGGSSIAIKRDGTLWGWGSPTASGIGGLALSSPVQIGVATDWAGADLVADTNHVIVIKKDGTLWAWGSNSLGQLGDGTTTNKSSPVQIGAATDWRLAGAARGVGAAIKSNGTLWVWGWNAYGQLGLGLTYAYMPAKSSPTQVGALTNWAQISSGQYSTALAAKKTDGTLWAWGLNNNGQLGQGDTNSRSSPVQVGAGTDWGNSSKKFGSYLTASRYQWVSRKADGSLWMPGPANYLHPSPGVSSPVQIGAATSWLHLSAGMTHMIGIKK